MKIDLDSGWRLFDLSADATDVGRGIAVSVPVLGNIIDKGHVNFLASLSAVIIALPFLLLS